MKSKSYVHYLIYFLIFFSILIKPLQASANQMEKNLTPVKLSLKWTHQFQFAGYYIAKELGFYQKAGLDVSFLEADPSIDPIQRVLDGQADFGVGTSDLILNFAAGDPVVVLGVTMQHSPIGLLTIDPQIQTLKDLVGKKIMIEENSAELFALLESKGLNRQDYILHRHHLSLDDLINKNVDAMSIYKTTELADVIAKGLAFKVFYPIESGIDFYGDNLFTTQGMLQKNLPLVDAFREASFKGWQYAMQNPDETIRLILEKYVTTRTYEQLHFEAEVMRELMQPNRIHPGKMTLNHWERMAQTYLDLGYIQTLPDMQTMLYLPEIKIAEMHDNMIKLTLGIVLLLITLIIMFVVARYLHINKKVYQSLIQNMPLALLVLDKDYKVEKWNKRAEQIFGWSKKEVINRNIFDFLVVHQDISGVRSTLNKVKYDQNRRQLINKNYTKEGGIINCSWTNTVVGDNKSQKIICMAIDLTELEELECFIQNQNSTSHADQQPDNATQLNNQMDEDTNPIDEQEESTQAEQLADIMKQALKIWFLETKKSKVELAEESQLWRVTLDNGSAKTRTLDKYLNAETIPSNPRWRNVFDTALFVIEHCPKNNQLAELKKRIDLYQQKFQKQC